jgi:RimJ/RimL family protein N-acetyltransferase
MSPYEFRNRARWPTGSLVRFGCPDRHERQGFPVHLVDSNWYELPILSGRHVRPEPLGPQHVEQLFRASSDPDIWRWLVAAPPSDLAAMSHVVAEALAARARNERLTWVQIDPRTGDVAGTTSYYEIVPAHRSLCIGLTWLATAWQRTGMNTEAKLLLLERAFDRLGAIRVAFYVHVCNHRSRASLERLGARYEGLLRNHRIRADGTFRNTAVYSIVDSEWAAVRSALHKRLRERIRS